MGFRLEIDHKYTYIFHESGHSEALRYGEKWQDLTGNNLVYSLAYRLADAREALDLIQKQHKEEKEQLLRKVADALGEQQSRILKLAEEALVE